MFQPEELKKGEPLLWSAGNGTEVWDLFCACAAGDLETVQRLVDHNPSLVGSHFEYRTPLYFAVRENQMTVARFLIARGARPFYNGDDLVEMARIRGHADMEALLESHRSTPQPVLSGVQLLMHAFRNREMSTVSRLTQEFLMPGSTCDIWTAAFVGNLKRVRELLDSDPSLVNRMGEDRQAHRLFSLQGGDNWKLRVCCWNVTRIPISLRKGTRRTDAPFIRLSMGGTSTSPDFFSNMAQIPIRRWRARRTLPALRS